MLLSFTTFTIMKKSIVCFFLLFLSCQIFTQNSKVLKFGSKRINLPKIQGYTECGDEEIIQSFFETLIPENSELIGFYLNNADYEYKEISFLLGINDYVSVYSMVKLKDFDVNADMFNSFDKVMDSIMGNINKEKFNEIIKNSVFSDVSLNQPILLEKFSVHPAVKSYMSYVTYFIDDKVLNMVFVLNNTLINDRLFQYAYYLKYEDENTINKAKQNNIAITKLILKSNNLDVNSDLEKVSLKPSKLKAKDSFFTKDGFDMGSKKEFVTNCKGGLVEMDFNGIKIDAQKYCNCMADVLIPSFTVNEIAIAYQKDDFSSLFEEDDITDRLMICMGENGFELEDDYTFENVDGSAFINTCIETMAEDGAVNYNSMKKYCECAWNNLKDKGINFGQLLEIDDQDKEAYNEVLLPCIQLLEEKGVNSYLPRDIQGFGDQSIIQLIPNGNTFKIKLSVDGITRYFLFDTGASELVINSKLENDLLNSGAIKPGDYLPAKRFETADGNVINAKGVRLNNIIIGGYKVNNVVAYITDEGGMLCGMGLLNKFNKWKFQKEDESLILFK